MHFGILYQGTTSKIVISQFRSFFHDRIVATTRDYLEYFIADVASLLPMSEFVLDEKFQRNASKFAIDQGIH